MRNILIYLSCLVILFVSCNNASQQQSNQQKEKFVWGTASASYQSEGFYQADGKGMSNWDVWTNKYEVTKFFIGKKHTGNDAVLMYDRKEYLKSIELMKQLGVNTYRFSISWSRIFPKGEGEVNQKGVDYYVKFVDHLLANGIEPMVTLFHWDIPQALYEQGGWHNRKIVDWYAKYAETMFKAFGNKVKMYITFNEPSIDNYLITPLCEAAIKTGKPMITAEKLAYQAVNAHHLMLAHAKALDIYKKMNLDGKIGMTLALIPSVPMDANNKKDVEASQLFDARMNQWFLDGALKGSYPEIALKAYQQYTKELNISKEDYALMQEAKTKNDFIGINYYGQSAIKYEAQMPFNALMNNRDSIKMFNGEVKPKQLYNLLMNIKNNYNNISVYITENGAGYGEIDEKMVNDTVQDNLRNDYIKSHIAAAMDAKKDGVNLNGYVLWSMYDNFEWMTGYDRRFGIVYVDFATQKKTPKLSFYTYKNLIQEYSK